jgi:uncharacterized protein (DUF1778 family)
MELASNKRIVDPPGKFAMSKPLANRRTRIITFRLEEEEYDLLRAACLRGDARSLSQFAREAVLNLVRVQESPQHLLTQDLSALNENLSELYQDLNMVRSRIGRVLGVGPKDR